MSSARLFALPRPAGEMAILTLGDSLVLTMIWCPAGDFHMGTANPETLSNNESPVHRVTLSRGFWISQTPIFQELWEYITMQRPRFFDVGSGLPVEGITWEESKGFAHKLTLLLRQQGHLEASQIIDLPTEAEWEYACRAGTRTPHFFEKGQLRDYCWYRDNSAGKKHPVGLKRANPWGIQDLYGNVFEWCLDDYSPYTPHDAVDPVFFHEKPLLKMARGGAYISRAEECRSASRETLDMNNPYNEPTGLRIVCRTT